MQERQLNALKDRFLTARKTKRSVERRRVKEAEPEKFGMGKTLCEANIPQTGSLGLVRGQSGAQLKRSFVQGCNKKKLTAKKKQMTPIKIHPKKEIYRGRRTTEENSIRYLFETQNNCLFSHI